MYNNSIQTYVIVIRIKLILLCNVTMLFTWRFEENVKVRQQREKQKGVKDWKEFHGDWNFQSSIWSGPEVIKRFSWSTQQSMKVSLVINKKMPAIVGIFIFTSWEIFMLSYVLQERICNC